MSRKEGKLHKNERGRYELDEETQFVCGSVIELKVCETWVWLLAWERDKRRRSAALVCADLGIEWCRSINTINKSIIQCAGEYGSWEQ